MPSYFLYELDDTKFENLVVHICRKILGAGTTSFSAGPDGGKDAKFEGKANHFPSASDPANGKFIIQAKHTVRPYASCSDSDFTRIVNSEVPRIKQQFDAGKLTHYLLFTNRRKTGGAEDKLTDLIKQKTGVEHVWVRANNDIHDELDGMPIVVGNLGLSHRKIPISIVPADIRAVIDGFYDHRFSVPNAFDGQHDFRDYPGIQSKNIINGLTEDYYQECILESSEPFFSQLRSFLQNPRNSEVADRYSIFANELKAQLIMKRNEFQSFDEALEAVYQIMCERLDGLVEDAKKRLVARILIHYMYVNCDIGKKKA